MSMGILQGIFNARDKPKDALGGSRYSFFFGSTIVLKIEFVDFGIELYVVNEL